MQIANRGGSIYFASATREHTHWDPGESRTKMVMIII
jgi:hypothetical protein